MFSLTMDETPKLLANQAAIIELAVAPVDQPSIVKLLVRLGLAKRLPRAHLGAESKTGSPPAIRRLS